MARTNKPTATTVAQAALQDLQKIDKQISLLERQTTFAVQQIAVASILDPVEGEIVIDHSDKHRLKWYSNGAWRSVCSCQEVLAMSLGFSAYTDWNTFQSDFAWHPGPPETGFPTMLTNVDPNGQEDFGYPMWLDTAHSQCLVAHYPAVGSTQTWDLIDSAGNIESVFTRPANTNFKGPYITENGAFAVTEDAGTGIVITHNMITGEQIGEFNALTLAASEGYNRISVPGGSLSWDTSRVAILFWHTTFPFGGERYRFYLMDSSDGGNLQRLEIPFRDNGGDSMVLGWFADGTRVFYRGAGNIDPYDNLHLVTARNVDDTNEEVIFESPGSLTDIGSSLQKVRSSRTGAKMGCLEYNDATNSWWHHTWDSQTYAVLSSWEIPNSLGALSNDWDWSPLEDEIFTMLEQPGGGGGMGGYVLNLATGTFEQLWMGTEDDMYIGQLTWSAVRPDNE